MLSYWKKELATLAVLALAAFIYYDYSHGEVYKNRLNSKVEPIIKAFESRFKSKSKSEQDKNWNTRTIYSSSSISQEEWERMMKEANKK